MTLRVVHVITTLGIGGAELALLRTVRSLRAHGIDSSVLCLREGGEIGRLLDAEGVTVIALDVSSPKTLIGKLRQVRSHLREWGPDVVQGWMYHGNLLAWWIRPRKVPLVFGIRQSLPSLSREKVLTRIAILLGALLSRRANAVVYNARSSIPQHQRVGYKSLGATCIPNGFDTNMFVPDTNLRSQKRDEWGIGADVRLVGLVARFHPVKDHALFVRSAKLVLLRYPRVLFAIVGRAVGAPESGLRAQVESAGLQESVRFYEEASDVPAIMNAMDVVCLTSKAEGFPNVVAEAMACGVPVVSTDVGDVAWIVGDTGVLVPAGDAERLAAAIIHVIEMPVDERKKRTNAARDRVRLNFSVGAVGRAYEKLYEKVVCEVT